MFGYELERGNIIIPRSIYKLDADHCNLFCYLVHKATFKERFDKHFKVNLQEGQAVASLRFIGERFGYSKNKASRLLNSLEEMELIEKTGTNSGQTRDTSGTPEGTNSGHLPTVITICNYRMLQTPSSYWRDTSGTPRNTQAGQTRDTSGTNKNNNNINNSNNEKRTSPDKPVPSPSNNGKIPYDAIKDLYNKRVKKARQEGRIFQNPKNQQWPLPPIRKMVSRYSVVKTRWGECDDLAEWDNIFNAVIADEFWTGRNGKWFGAGFDNIMRREHFNKFRDRAADNGGKPNDDGMVNTPQGKYNQGILKGKIEVINLRE